MLTELFLTDFFFLLVFYFIYMGSFCYDLDFVFLFSARVDCQVVFIYLLVIFS